MHLSTTTVPLFYVICYCFLGKVECFTLWKGYFELKGGRLYPVFFKNTCFDIKLEATVFEVPSIKITGFIHYVSRLKFNEILPQGIFTFKALSNFLCLFKWNLKKRFFSKHLLKKYEKIDTKGLSKMTSQPEINETHVKCLLIQI